MAPPLAFAHILIHAHELPRNCDEQADRLLRNFDRIAACGVTDDQTVIFGRFEVHAVDADPGATDDFGPFELRDDFARKRHGTVHDNAIRVFAHLHDLGVVGRPPNRHVGVDLSENRLDQVDRYVVAPEINYVKLTHVI